MQLEHSKRVPFAKFCISRFSYGGWNIRRNSKNTRNSIIYFMIRAS